jgi:hypothetical protein
LLPLSGHWAQGLPEDFYQSKQSLNGSVLWLAELDESATISAPGEGGVCQPNSVFTGLSAESMALPTGGLAITRQKMLALFSACVATASTTFAIPLPPQK